MTRALGRYELLRPIARGGMAEVYLARRRAAGIEKWLVVKRMRPERSKDPRFLDLFVREARLSMSLAHQNIVPVFDFGRIDDQVFLAMERVEGRDLGSSLARATTRRVPPLLAAFIAAECCQALDYAHQRKGPDGVALGIVHRDVTPRNVMLSWSGEVKLTDFGIAALAGDATQRLLGTPQYMAPEQARGEPIDPRADIYAIGLVLREALCGVRPRPGADRDAILDAARRGALLPWSHPPAPPAPPGPPDDELALGSVDEPSPLDDLPPDLVAIVDRATAPDAADRYPDARSMLEELDSFIVGQRAAHKVESPARQLAAWLAAVWDGARDDGDVDASIDAEHLVSFLDDGALDVLGTGTIRSMAATAADEPLIVPPGATTGAAPPEPAGPAGAVPGASRRSESSGRIAPISSSRSSVASGSFHALQVAAADPRGAPAPAPAPVPRGEPRRLRRLGGSASVLAVAAAALWIALGDRGPAPGPPSSAPAAVTAVASTAGASAAPAVAPPQAPPPVAAIADAPPAPQVAPAAPAEVKRPGSGHAAAIASPPVAPPRALRSRGSADAGAPVAAIEPDAPAIGSAAALTSGVTGGSAAPITTTDGSAGSAAPAQPATCRVRINLTPWAYYTVDDDPTRHETPSSIDLTPGTHRLHVWNPELKIERDIVLQVPANRDTMTYSAPLQPSALPGTPPLP